MTKIVVLSDLHIGKVAWGSYGLDMLRDGMDMLEPGDHLVLNGDIVELNESSRHELFDEVLDRIRTGTKDAHVLYNVGNKELQFVQGPMTQWEDELRLKMMDYGIALAEGAIQRVYTKDRCIRLVGTIGWCDGSMWDGQDDDGSEYPNTLDSIRARAQNEHYPDKYPTWDFDSCQAFHDKVQRGLKSRASHLNNHSMGMNPDDEWMLFSHFVTSKDLVQGATPRFRYLNYFMGWDADPFLATVKKKATQIVVGHTHRHDSTIQSGVPVQNASGATRPFVIEL